MQNQWAVFTEVDGRLLSRKPIMAATKQEADKIVDDILSQPMPENVETIRTAVIRSHEINKYLKSAD
jgi:hypothetical protein